MCEPLGAVTLRGKPVQRQQPSQARSVRLDDAKIREFAHGAPNKSAEFKAGRAAGKAAVKAHLKSQRRRNPKPAVPFPMNGRIVRRRVYVRWCERRGLEPREIATMKIFARRKQWEKARAIEAARKETARARANR
jgi:hypothetical protein